MAVSRLEQGGEIVSRQTGIPKAAVNRGQQTAHHRDQVGRELQGNRMAGGAAAELFNLTGVAMAHHAIRGNTLRSFREQQVFLGGAATATGAGLGIDHDAARFNQTLLQQWRERQQAGRGETTRCRHQPGCGDPLCIPLHKAVHRLSAEIAIAAGEGARLRGVHLVPLLEGAVAIVGGEVHHLHAPLQQRWNQGGGQTIGQAQHRQVCGCSDRIRIR